MRHEIWLLALDLHLRTSVLLLLLIDELLPFVLSLIFIWFFIARGRRKLSHRERCERLACLGKPGPLQKHSVRGQATTCMHHRTGGKAAVLGEHLNHKALVKSLSN